MSTRSDLREPTCDILGLFPIPFMRLTAAIDPELLDACLAMADSSITEKNLRSGQLSHSTVLKPEEHPAFRDLADTVAPALAEFGMLMFGERLNWSIKEMWANVLEHGGHQSIHSHANSFVSGILYLTESHPSARTVFYKSLGSTDFPFTNKHEGAITTQCNGDRWVCPPVSPGDIVL
ncbi:MAG TPA: putative 2OG-Fe(II) oxygenase, partial [Steroidobacteraceae bacterium]|nr:putative 2OG-Fe(II) oxygenase [Steroidobacteraceae bacterium]